MNMMIDNPIFIKPLINVGALFDIPTGSFIKGPKGEHVLNGGVSAVEGMVGRGNNFKSTIMHYLMLQASNRMNYSGIHTTMHTYDTEDNMLMNLDRLNRLADKMEWIESDPLYNPKVWSVITKSQMSAEKWVELLYTEAMKNKEDKKKWVKYTSFINKLTNKVVEFPKPSFIEIDSLTEFESNATMTTVEKGKIEDSNMMFMQQGLFKSKFVKDIPRISTMANVYFFLTAHIGKEYNIAAGPFAPQPKKALQYLKQDEKILGVSGKANFLFTHFWYAHNSTALINQNTKMPEYPNNEDDVETDLNIVKLLQLRSKSGPSGYILEIIVSQREGVLPSLTEFHYLKTNKFGIGGNPRNFYLELYPDVKLMRTTVRSKIDEDPKLRRAINITAELLQMRKFMPQYKHLFCTPEELYNDIKKLGYDWDEILGETRGWWTIDNYNTDLKFLSTLDLLKIRAGEYTPFWKKEK